MRIVHYLILAGGLLLVGLAHAKQPSVDAMGEAKLAKRIAGRVAGKPIDCINLSDIIESEVIDGTAIVYTLPGNTLYVNRPQMGRESLDSNDMMVTRTFTSQLCNIDTIRMVDRTTRMPHSVIGLGDFVPYAKPR